MALQGTLETFALPDVLRLLASTHKTGRLRLTGAAGSGSLWLDRRGHRGQRGQPVAARRQRRPTCCSSCCGSRRVTSSSTTTSPPASAGSRPTSKMRSARPRACSRSGSRSRPSCPRSTAGSRCAPSCPTDEVTLDAARWQQMVAVGGGITVAQLGDDPRPGRAARVPHGQGPRRARPRRDRRGAGGRRRPRPRRPAALEAEADDELRPRRARRSTAPASPSRRCLTVGRRRLEQRRCSTRTRS